MSLMRDHGRGCVLVCEGDRLCGILTERDVLTRILASGGNLDAPIASYMTRDPVTIRRSDRIASVLRLMLDGGYRHLPIVNDRGVPLGVVSVKGLIHYLVEHFPAAVYNLPPSPGSTQQNREGA